MLLLHPHTACDLLQKSLLKAPARTSRHNLLQTAQSRADALQATMLKRSTALLQCNTRSKSVIERQQDLHGLAIVPAGPLVRSCP